MRCMVLVVCLATLPSTLNPVHPNLRIPRVEESKHLAVQDNLIKLEEHKLGRFIVPRPEVGPSVPERIIHAAIAYLGMPYEFGGKGDKSTDCSQLVINVLGVLGFQVPDSTAGELRQQLFTLSEPPDSGPVVGAIFRRKNGKISHIGILGPSMDTVVHATASDGRVVLKALEKVDYDEIAYLDFRALMDYLGVRRPANPKSV